MTQVRNSNTGGDIAAITKTTGAIIPVEPGKGCTLAASTVYYFPVGDADSTYKGIQAKWDGLIVVTLTLWECIFPKTLLGMGGGGVDVSDIDVTSGSWIQLNPTSAVINTTSDDGSTGGATVTGATVVVAGGTAGGAVIDIGNIGSRRLRVRASVGGTGGVLRIGESGKE